MSKLAIYLFFYVLLLSSGLLILRYLMRKDYLKHGRLSPSITILQALVFFAYGGFPYLYLDTDWPAVSVPLFMHAIGISLVFSGLGFLLYGMMRLGVMRSMGRGKPQLERSGIYSVSRNPQAIACGLYVIGFLILWPSWFAVGWALLYVILIHIMVLTEEEYLLHKHAEKYQEYCGKVPRYLGRKSFLRNGAG